MAQTADILGIRFGIHQDRTRIVVDMTSELAVRARADAPRSRVLIDMPAVVWNLQASPQSVPRGLAREVRYGTIDPNLSRIVIDTDGPAAIVNSFVLPPAGETPYYRFVIDIAGAPGVAVAPPAEPVTAPMPRQKEPPRPEDLPQREAATRPPEPARQDVRPERREARPVGSPDPGANPLVTPGPGTRPIDSPKSDARPVAAPVNKALEPPSVGETVEDPSRARLETARTPPRRIDLPPSFMPVPRPELSEEQIRRVERPLIAIDAGHGGIDPGAIAASGILEKNITLEMAYRLAAALNTTGRYRTLLVREHDKFIRLRDRIELAHKAEADIFISVHADSIGDPKFRGASVYTLSETASDEEAASLATKENKADIIGGTDLSHHDEVVASILIDLAQRDTNNKSIDLADHLVDELGDVTHMVKNTRRYAGFAVLKSPDTPSVLVELGYLSNDNDAANLVNPEHQKKLAHAITEAVDRYFQSFRPPL
ncbi:MAG: N-acetylmuramoyl-L-alanine amidase [Geminicoccaceae bacterium]